MGEKVEEIKNKAPIEEEGVTPRSKEREK